MNSRIIFTVINDLTYDQRMHRICTSMANDGYDVLLVGRKLRSSVPLQREQFSQKRLSLFFSRGKLFYIEYNIRLFFFLLFKKFNIVCGVDLDTILPCYFISKIKSKKCVYDAHEIFSETPEVVRRKFVKGIWKSIEKFSVKRIQNCYTVSQSLADYFRKNYGRKFEVIKNFPVKIHNQISSPANELGFVLYQGALNEGRGLEQMIDAMQDISLRFVLAGEGDLSDSLRKKVKQLHLEHKIEFTGMKTSSELQKLTAQSFIGINLLENNSLSYYYSLANKFFDYVHAGVPQITMNFPEYKNMNAEFEVALLIDDLKTETIVSAVNRLLQQKDFYFRLRKNCFRAREAWNWQKEEPKLLSFYRQLK
ncbi:MAG: glycosyltransferase [Chitinophagales bacterium]